MANEKHLLLTISGDYVPNTLPGEIWENTLRLALVFGAVDPVGTLPDNWDPVAATIARTETNWTINGNWTVDGPLGAGFDPGDYLNDQVAPAITTWMAFNKCSNQVRVRRLSLAAIGAPSGNQVPAPPYASGTPCVLEYTSAYPVGSPSTTQLPPQNSIVVSHRTQQIGAHGRGRMFLPSPTSGSLTGAKIASADQTAIADAQHDLLVALGVEVSDDVNLRPIVTGSPWVNYAVINSVRVGSVMDTQRRRRNRIAETYVSQAVTY